MKWFVDLMACGMLLKYKGQSGDKHHLPRSEGHCVNVWEPPHTLQEQKEQAVSPLVGPRVRQHCGHLPHGLRKGVTQPVSQALLPQSAPLL